MRSKHKLSLLLAAASIVAGCDNNDDMMPDTPDVPTEGYHLTFGGGVGVETDTRAVWNDDKGSGNLIFRWDYTPEGAEKHEMVMALAQSELVASIEGNYHTYASIHKHSEHSDDAHWATFKTLEKYQHDIFSGMYENYNVLAVTPICDANGATVESSSNEFIPQMPMPDTFIQVADQKPDFLRNYMYMYACKTIVDNSATLQFKHIPATFRFIITNKRPTEANITSVQVSQSDAALPVASKSVSINSKGELTFSQDTHTTITTKLGENGTVVDKDAKYTAYALALPLADNTAFKEKKLQFTIATDSEPANEYLSFVLEGELLEGANRTLSKGVYNWLGGKSYTILMSLSDVLTFEGITAEPWTTVNGGELETE